MVSNRNPHKVGHKLIGNYTKNIPEYILKAYIYIGLREIIPKRSRSLGLQKDYLAVDI